MLKFQKFMVLLANSTDLSTISTLAKGGRGNMEDIHKLICYFSFLQQATMSINIEARGSRECPINNCEICSS